MERRTTDRFGRSRFEMGGGQSSLPVARPVSDEEYEQRHRPRRPQGPAGPTADFEERRARDLARFAPEFKPRAERHPEPMDGSRFSQEDVFLLLGALLCAAACFAPWWSAELAMFGISETGFDSGHGKLAFFGFLAAGLSILAHRYGLFGEGSAGDWVVGLAWGAATAGVAMFMFSNELPSMPFGFGPSVGKTFWFYGVFGVTISGGKMVYSRTV